MKKVLKLSALLTVAALMLLGCTRSPIQQPEEDISDSLTITYLTGPNIKNGQTLSLLIENQTDYCFDFSPDYNIVINIAINGSWVKIPNNITISGNKADILMPASDPGAGDFLDALPDLSKHNISSSTEAYITISGHLCDDENFVVEKKIPFSITP